ncbi:hypothetical protein ACR6C2_00085 [Streptomyces sp. INA 01156]
MEITLTGNGPLTPVLAQAVRRSLGFGLPEEVVLPRGAVESLTVSGPEWLSGNTGTSRFGGSRRTRFRWPRRLWRWSSSTANRSPPATRARWRMWGVAVSAGPSRWTWLAAAWS